MDEHIDMDNPLCRAYWCGNFSCSDAELANAVRVMDSTVVGLVGLYPWPRADQDPVPSIGSILPWTDDGQVPVAARALRHQHLDRWPLSD